MENKLLESINHTSSTENVANLLREAVLDGRLKPGMKLREQALCEELGVSRTPLREAFRILQVERLLDYEPFIGVRVARFSSTFLRETWDIRNTLESFAVEQCITNFVESDRNEYLEILDLIKKLDLSNVVVFEEYDEKLHMLIASKSRNSELEQMIIDLWKRTAFLRKVALYKSIKRVASSQLEHINILNAILSLDKVRAKKQMWCHFINSKSDVELSAFFSEGMTIEE